MLIWFIIHLITFICKIGIMCLFNVLFLNQNPPIVYSNTWQNRTKFFFIQSLWHFLHIFSEFYFTQARFFVSFFQNKSLKKTEWNNLFPRYFSVGEKSKTLAHSFKAVFVANLEQVLVVYKRGREKEYFEGKRE